MHDNRTTDLAAENDRLAACVTAFLGQTAKLADRVEKLNYENDHLTNEVERLRNELGQVQFDRDMAYDVIEVCDTERTDLKFKAIVASDLAHYWHRQAVEIAAERDKAWTELAELELTEGARQAVDAAEQMGES